MRVGGFGQSGQAQSQQFAWQACVICGAPIRVSFFLVGFFLLQAASTVNGGFHIWELLFVCGQQAILILTVLCHEFGHGNAARAIGGEIDHILLWPFGGICFSSRPENVQDTRVLLKNDLLVVAAGPATHFLMTPAWAALLAGFGALMEAHCAPHACASCEGLDCVWMFLNPLSPGPGLFAHEGHLLMGDAAALLWRLLGLGVKLNVGLFLFNVFFPMYPADGAKLLTVGLMHCCGTSARTAATALIWSSSICAVLLIVYAMYTFSHAFRHGSNQLGMMMPGLMGMMGIMSLMEAYRIYNLREEQRLHVHPLFRTARTWGSNDRDGLGQFNRINQRDHDDPVDRSNGNGGYCCLCACCPPSAQSSDEDEVEMSRGRNTVAPPLPVAPLGGVAAAPEGPQRAAREGFLQKVESFNVQQGKSVRQLQDEQSAAASSR